jgi:hypothetical protein
VTLLFAVLELISHTETEKLKNVHRLIVLYKSHKHLNTTMRYVDLNENKLRSAVELVDY